MVLRGDERRKGGEKQRCSKRTDGRTKEEGHFPFLLLEYLSLPPSLRHAYVIWASTFVLRLRIWAERWSSGAGGGGGGGSLPQTTVEEEKGKGVEEEEEQVAEE